MAEHNNDYSTSVEAVKRVQEERPINFFAKTWAALTQALSNKASQSNTSSAAKTDFSIATYLSTLQNPGSLSPMLLYELQLHLSAIQPRRKKNAAAASPSASHRKGAEPLTYEDIECGCCFSDISIEQATSCADGCLFCKECLSRTVQESVYGQAPLRLWRSYSGSVASVEPNTFPEEEGAGGEGTGIRCLSIEGCQASFSDKELRRCLSKELYMALETRLVEQNLQIYQAASARLKNKGGQARIVNCPFCPYVAIEDVPTVNYLWYNTSTFLDILRSLASLFTISLLYLCWLLSAIFVPELLNTSSQSIGQDKIVSKMSQERQEPVYLTIQPVAGFRAIQERIQQIFDTCLTKHNGTVFRCRNIANDGQTKSPSGTFASPTLLYSMLPPLPPSVLSAQASHVKTSSSDTCGRHSCRLCLKLHYAGHQCIDKTEGLRLVKEQAASNAIKRQCPECGLSFVKDNGCNKITCRCGYVMCFVCRKGIAGERYAHFCQHPRNPGSACTVCTNCDLFKEEDETLAVRKAVQRAEQEWLRDHPEVDNTSIPRHGENNMNFTPLVLGKLEDLTRSTVELLLSWRS